MNLMSTIFMLVYDGPGYYLNVNEGSVQASSSSGCETGEVCLGRDDGDLDPNDDDDDDETPLGY